MSDIIKVYALAEMYPDGQKTDAAIIEYDTPISNSLLNANAFCVKNRTIEKVYANDKPERSEIGTDGKYVIIELSVKDADANVVVEPERTKPGPPPPKARVVPHVSVQQLEAIKASDGSVIPAGNAVDSTETIEPVVEDFRILEHEGLKYNLYIPKDYEPEKSYPLVMFIADIGANGLDDRMALSQGIGGTIWATPEEQKKHPSFVLVPQFPFKPIMKDDFTFDPMFNLIKKLIDYICSEYRIDKNRIYATGQSQGCMAACELNAEYPDLFAACMLVAGQWDPEKMAQSCVGQKYWILVSEIDEKASKGMDAIVDKMAEKGTSVKRFYWNAKDSKEEIEKKVKEALKEDVDIRYTYFTGDSVLSEDDKGPNRHHHAHSCTWPIAYDIEGVRDWLFSCKK